MEVDGVAKAPGLLAPEEPTAQSCRMICGGKNAEHGATRLANLTCDEFARPRLRLPAGAQATGCGAVPAVRLSNFVQGAQASCLFSVVVWVEATLHTFTPAQILAGPDKKASAV